MGDYIVSARKYRPMTFATVVGQGALTTTLKNSIANNKLAHAYLFCGPRGVGKTTCARIFARTINCLNPTPEGEACNECESCVAFRERRSYNIHELDAASNNSVEDIRTLIDQVRIPPQIGRYKVYIIDEVHMLSQAAFNAFLKTLEEPPRHAVFILATTEKHKILPTILSRCQIYDFNRISVTDAADYLAQVAEKEGFEAEPEALNVIAQKADGGMRDALSIFDQVVSFTNGHITYQSVIDNLNILDCEYYFRLTDAMLEHNVQDCFLIFNEILSKGFDGSHFVTGLASHFRDLLVSKDPVTLPLLEAGATIRDRYKSQAVRCPIKFLYRAIRIANDCDINYRASKNKRLLVEVALIRLAQITPDGEEEIPGGRSPKQELKPIEIKNVNAGAIFANTNNSGTNLANNNNARTNTNNVGATPAITNNAGTEEVIKKQKPAYKKGSSFGFSIRQSAEKATDKGGSEVKTNTEEAQPAQSPEGSSSIDQKQLEYRWREFASSLPQEETANSKRMMNMQPVVTDPKGSFEVTVENDNVRNNMLRLQNQILTYLGEKLHNNNLQMNIRVMEAAENNRVFSPAERFNLMAAKNPKLLKLKEELGLELY